LKIFLLSRSTLSFYKEEEDPERLDKLGDCSLEN